MNAYRHYYGIWSNVIRIARRWMGVKFAEKSVSYHLTGPTPGDRFNIYFLVF